MIMRRLRNYFLTGLLILSPIILTIFLILWLFELVDSILNEAVTLLLKRGLGMEYLDGSIPGLGFVAVILLILFTGMLARNYFGNQLLKLGEEILNSIPLVNKIYSAIQQIFSVFLSEKREVFNQAIIFEYPRKGIYCIGFMTRPVSGEVRKCLQQDAVSVFVPTTPNPTSGFLLFVPNEEILELDMSIEDALKLIVSGGAVIPSELPEKNTGTDGQKFSSTE